MTDSDTHAQLANLIGGSLLPIIYGLLTTDVSYPLIKQNNYLFDCSPFQQPEFTSVIKEYLTFMEVLELTFTPDMVLLKAAEAFDKFSTEHILVKNFAEYFPQVLSRIKQNQKPIQEGLMNQIIETIRRTCKEYEFEVAQQFEPFCSILLHVLTSEKVGEEPTIATQNVFSCILLMLKNQHKFHSKQFNECINVYSQTLEQFLDEHDIRDELLQILEKTGYGEYIFEQPTLKQLLLDQIRQEIFTKLPLY